MRVSEKQRGWPQVPKHSPTHTSIAVECFLYCLVHPRLLWHFNAIDTNSLLFPTNVLTFLRDTHIHQGTNYWKFMDCVLTVFILGKNQQKSDNYLTIIATSSRCFFIRNCFLNFFILLEKMQQFRSNPPLKLQLKCYKRSKL